MSPAPLQTDAFRFEVLAPAVADLDYAAVMSSRSRLRGVFAANDSWPRDDMSFDDNRRDLERHAAEFEAGEAFAYAVFSASSDDYLGCVYINPTSVPGYDCAVYLWVRDSQVEQDPALFSRVKSWLDRDWPLAMIAFPGRDIPWGEWPGESPE